MYGVLVVRNPPSPSVLRARMLIADRFQRLLAKTKFTLPEIERYQTHVAGVARRLETSFKLHERIRIGSAARGSAIRQSSDVDLMLVLRMSELRWGDHLVSSFTTLDRVREELQSRFWNTELGRDGQAIVASFQDGQYAIDIVPAGFSGIENKMPIYLIPDGYGGWMTTSPQTHNTFLARANLRSAGKLTHVAKLIKYWRWCRTPELPLSSFHVEMLLAGDGLTEGAKSYAECLVDLFDSLRSRDCRALQDPFRIAGLISAANTAAKLNRVVAAVDFSADHARAALLAEREGSTIEAIRQWNLVFNCGFPT